MGDDVQIVLDDFARADWTAVIAASSSKDCSRYWGAFNDAAQQFKSNGDAAAAAALRLLSDLSTMMLTHGPDSRVEPFGPLAVMESTRTAIPQDFTDAELDLFEQLLPQAIDAEIRARLADVLWIRRRGFSFARTSIEAYLDSARALAADSDWAPGVRRIERALRLASQLRRGNEDLFNTVTLHIEDVLTTYDAETDPGLVASTLMALLLEVREGDPLVYSVMAEDLAKRRETRKEWRGAQTYWGLVARWHRMAGDDTEARAAELAAAETHVKAASDALNQQHKPLMLAASHLQDAIQAMRQLGQAERAEQLHADLLRTQSEARSEMVSITQEIDLSEVADAARKDVSGKDMRTALLTLAAMLQVAVKDDLSKFVDDLARETPFQHLIRSTPINRAGKVVATRGSLFSEDPNEAARAKRAEMLSQARHRQQLQVLGILYPALQIVSLEHEIARADVLGLVRYSPFVPHGRAELFARGLHAGLQTDWLTACHFLIPQIENTVRVLMNQIGAITSTLEDPEGIQQEHNLNTLLYRPELETIFSPDLIFDLQGLLVEKFGSNLRNDVAHGLLDDDEFASPSVAYLWWLALHLICLPYLWAEAATDGENEALLEAANDQG